MNIMQLKPFSLLKTLSGRHDRIPLYIPNLIGYARIICALMAFAMSSTSVYMTLALYFLSFACDELDGRAARLLGQQSTMGAVLDMVTDRVATCGLVTVLYGRIVERPGLLKGITPEWVCGGDLKQVQVVVLIGLMFLDVISHWFHMYASLATQGLGSSHKTTQEKDPWLIQMYYKHRLLMGYCCVSVEVEYLVMYAMTFPEVVAQWGSIAHGVAILCGPGFVLKQVAHGIQLVHACAKLVELDLGVVKQKTQKKRQPRSASVQRGRALTPKGTKS